MRGWRFVGLCLAAVSLAGCGTQPTPGDDGDWTPFGTTPGGVAEKRPVAVDGLESCDSLAKLAKLAGARGPVEDGLESTTLDCLIKGPAVDLASVRGRPVLVNLWASWCGPCRDEAPVLAQGYLARHADITFVGVDTRDAGSSAADFLSEFGITYPQLADPQAALLHQLRVPGLPVTFVLGTDGRVVARHIGAVDEESLNDLLDQAGR